MVRLQAGRDRGAAARWRALRGPEPRRPRGRLGCPDGLERRAEYGWLLRLRPRRRCCDPAERGDELLGRPEGPFGALLRPHAGADAHTHTGVPKDIVAGRAPPSPGGALPATMLRVNNIE